jgi:hypothetical protein
MTDKDLQQLTWRFAAMIGIIQASDQYASAAQVAKDRATWPALLVTKNGQAVFDL